MIDRWKAALRAWLLEVVREAIRLERVPNRYAIDSPEYRESAEKYLNQPNRAWAKPNSASKPISLRPSASFEAMQDEAIQQCEVVDERTM